MGAPTFMYRPGLPDNDGMYEDGAGVRRAASGRPIPGNVATRHVTFADMTEREIYTGASRAVRRNGRREAAPVKYDFF